MKKNDVFTKFLILFVAIFLFSLSTTAQVGIGTTTPAGGSILDLTSADKGFLVPRVNIANLADIAPVTGGATVGLLVWNTRAGTGIGYHYWSGARWIPLGAGGVDWALAGNAITAANFLGTTNNMSLNIRTNNNERMRVQANGQTTVGFAGAANAGDQFSAVGTTGVAGYSGGSGNGVYGQNIGSGNAVYGINNSTGNAVYGLNIGSGPGVYAENYWLNNYSLHAVDGAVSVYADNSTFGGDAVVGDTNSNISNAFWGINNNNNGTGILGGKDNVYVYTTGGSGVAASGTNIGLFAYAGNGNNLTGNRGNAAGVFDLDTDSNPGTNGSDNGTRAYAKLAGFDNVSPDGVLSSQDSYYGGYFVGGNINRAGSSYAYAGIKYIALANGSGGTNYKIIGNGTNSTIITDRNNTPRILFSPEAPEILFEDYGIGKLVNGSAQISIDPIFKDAIHVDESHPLKVFIQLEGDCNGVYVTNKSADGFTVKELQNGNSNVSFSWHIVANRADSKDVNGEITSKHVGLRFPEGPGLLKPIELKSKTFEKLPNTGATVTKSEEDISKKLEIPKSKN